MRASRRRGWAAVPLVIGLLLTGSAAPASATPARTPAPAPQDDPGQDHATPTYTAPAGRDEPVSLVVGLKPATADVEAPVERLEERTDVVVSDAEPVPGAHAVTVDVPADDLAEAAAALRSDPTVAYVERDHVARLAEVSVNDPYRHDQWGLRRAAVPAAWSVTRGAPTVVVAVVDTGVTATTDLAGRVLPGYDFVDGDTGPGDGNGHGTQVASVIAGVPNNGVATAGICWYCKILPVRALGKDGSGSYSDIAKSIIWAANHGADIINLSLGGSQPSKLFDHAVAYAAGRGALVVAAAGNDGRPQRHYPAATAGVLSVGASASGDQRYPWSNYGASWVDVAAPGCNPAQTRHNEVDLFCGTSSATPFVAGVAALARSLRPEPSAAQVRNLLTSTASPLGGRWVAAGRVDAEQVVTLAAWSTGVGASTHVRRDLTLTPSFRAALPVTGVAATVDGVTVATDTTAPWSLPVSTAALSGPATVAVYAYNGTTEVAALSRALVVDKVVPTVSFRSPGTAARVGRTVTVGADAFDGFQLARVDLLAGSRVVATDMAGPWSLRWPSAGNGRTTLTLRASDAAGNTASAARTVVLDNAGPATSITSGPADGGRVGGRVSVRVEATDPGGVARVQLLVDGKVVGTVAGSSGTFRFGTAAYGRTLKVKARAYDRVGNARTSGTRTWRR